MTMIPREPPMHSYRLVSIPANTTGGHPHPQDQLPSPRSERGVRGKRKNTARAETGERMPSEGAAQGGAMTMI